MATGYKNYIAGAKTEESELRIRICRSCPKHFYFGSALWCKKCGCFLPAKARVPDENCPLGKWTAAEENKADI
jgi:hypothetical protein